MLVKLLFMLVMGALSLATSAQSVRIATYQYADNNRVKNIQPFADHLKAEYNLHATVQSYATIHDLINAVQQHEVDVAFINTFGYLLLETSAKSNPMIPGTALQVEKDAVDNYKTAIIVPARSPLYKMDDLSKFAGQSKLMLVARGSTSGNLVPRLAFSNIGLADAEKDFRTVAYAGNHNLAIQSVLNNEADIAAMGYTEYEKMTKDPAVAKKLKLIWLSPEIPLGPVLLHKDLPVSTRSKINEALVSLHQRDMPALESIKAGWSEAKFAVNFIHITDAYYNAFRKTLGNEKDLQRILQQFAN